MRQRAWIVGGLLLALCMPQCGGGGVEEVAEKVDFLLSQGKFQQAIDQIDGELPHLTATDPFRRVLLRQKGSALLALAIVSGDTKTGQQATFLSFLAGWAGYKDKTGTTLQKIFQILPAAMIERAANISQARAILEEVTAPLAGAASDNEGKRAFQLLGTARLLELGTVFFKPDRHCNTKPDRVVPDGRPDDPLTLTAEQLSQFNRNVATAESDFRASGIETNFLTDLSDALKTISSAVDAIPGSGTDRNQALNIYINGDLGLGIKGQFADSIDANCAS